MIDKNKLSGKKKEIILAKFNKTLTVESATVGALAGYGIFGYPILLMVLTYQAYLYTFYLIKTLYTLKKTNWIIAFGIMVFGPKIFFWLLGDNIIASTISGSISLFMFYLYCWILKFAVAQWLEEVRYEDMDFSN